MPVEEVVYTDLNAEDKETAAVAEEYKPGELAPSIVTDQKVWKPADFESLGKKTFIGTLTDLVNTCATTDEAARRFSVLQTWESRHMDRGYQYLEAQGDKGGWGIAGGDTKNPIGDADDANLYTTNILSAQGDIVVGALCRGKIKTSFAPRRSKNPADAQAADEANKYRYIWEKANSELQGCVMGLGWTDCRVVGWTRSIVDKGRFGENDKGELKVVQVTTAHGVLETKLPMMVDRLDQCGYAQIFEEQDYAVARAAYPWMGNKIKPSWGTFGELEFERIARINTRIGITGKYVTGTSGLRETTMGYIWMRPGLYFDDKVEEKQREFLLENFPDGLFIVMAGSEFCCCWNESMDASLEIGLYTRGFGQNRRALNSSDIPIQKRINIWADMWDKFIRKSAPGCVLHDEAFNAEAISQLESDPGRITSAVPPENMTLDQCMMPMPVSQPLPGMQEMFQFYIGPLLQSIDGGTPSLFGGGEGTDNTVGATQIRLQQSLERFGPVWIMANNLFAGCVTKAAKNCARNGNDEYNDTVEGVGDVNVKKANLQGDFDCIAETVNAIPESGAQREAKVLQILEMANRNPQVASLVGKPSNAREIVRGLHMDDILTITEANSEDGALEDIERLLVSEPNINPAWAQLNQQGEQLYQEHEAAKQTAMQVAAEGLPIDSEVLSAGDAMEKQLQAMKQQMAQTPKYLPSIAVPDDESLDYDTIATTVFDWMQESDGRSLRRAAATEQEGGENWKKWTNVYLYWQGMKAQADKMKAQNVPPIPPKMTITIPVDKMQGNTQAQLLAKAGVQVTPPQTGEPHEVEEEQRLYLPGGELVRKAKRRL